MKTIPTPSTTRTKSRSRAPTPSWCMSVGSSFQAGTGMDLFGITPSRGGARQEQPWRWGFRPIEALNGQRSCIYLLLDYAFLMSINSSSINSLLGKEKAWEECPVWKRSMNCCRYIYWGQGMLSMQLKFRHVCFFPFAHTWKFDWRAFFTVDWLQYRKYE